LGVGYVILEIGDYFTQETGLGTTLNQWKTANIFFDVRGRTYKTTDATQTEILTTFDELNRAVSVSKDGDIVNTSYAYTATGGMTLIIDRNPSGRFARSRLFVR
jgi:predicted nuclease of predicted toxin-antitoxin system